VVTGYIDVVQIQLNTKSHELHVFGRSKCADLVDCSAEWPGGQISGDSVLEIARKLAMPYGIEVDTLDDVGRVIDAFQLMRGETPFEIIERLCRFRQLLAYDDTDGNLLLARTASRHAASGFREGINVEAATVDLSMHDRFSKYRCFFQSVDTLQDLGGGGDIEGTATDPGVHRHRVRIIVAEAGGGDLNAGDVAQARADWEAARRYGRSYMLRLTTDSWRDKVGALYEPNTLVTLDLPTLKVTGKTWVISEVTYRRDLGGSRCDLTCMPSEAFEQQLTFIAQLPGEFSQLPPNPGITR
jgi:prophage tail gpP-like protein